MKKFSKILTLILSLVLIVTAFTVIALATDGATEPSSTPYVRVTKGEWESLNDGDYLGIGTRGMRRGYIYAEADINGNMYEVYMPGITKGNDSDVWYDTFGDYSASTGNTISREYETTDAEGNPVKDTKKITKYNLGDYPYVVYDFDIMTPTGYFGSSLTAFSYRTYAYFYTKGGGYGYSGSANTNKAMGDTGASLLSISPSNVFDHLDSTPYNWQHVTLISKAFVGTNGPAFEVYVYVDGVLKNPDGEPYVYQNTQSMFTNTLLEDLGFAYLRQSASYDGSKLVDLSGFKKDDMTTWPDSDPSEWYENKTALDNPEFTHFQADWDHESIAARNWEKFEEKVPESAPKASASLTRLDGSVVYFASAKDAVAKAVAGETVTVLADYDEPITINKAIIFDIGMNYIRDIDGSGSGTATAKFHLGNHNAPFYSTVGVAYDYADGVYTFEETSDTYTVNWDPDCEGECNCPDEAKHFFKGTTVVAVGNAPLPIKSVIFEPLNGKVIDILGWKTSPNGETLQLSEISAASGETITIYPVYKITQYDFEVINALGKSSFYFAKDFGTQMQIVAKSSGTILKLHQNVYTECATITVTANFTLDLNGHKLQRSFIYGDFYEVTKDAETGEYVVPETATAVADSPHFFSVNADNLKVKVISTLPGGTIYNASMNAVVWTYEGEVVKRTSSSTNKNGILFYMPSSQSCNAFSLSISDVNLYIGRLWYQNSASAGGTAGFTLTIDNCKIYKMSNDSSRFIEARSDKNYTITATDTLFYAAANTSFIMFGTNGSKTATTTVTFTNCDFVKKDGSYAYGITNTRHAYNYLTFDNCRHYDVNGTNGIAKNGTLYRSSQESKQGISTPVIADGYVAMEKTITYSYTVPSKFDWDIDTSSDINTINFNVATTTRKQTYEYIVTKEVNVNWIGGDGKVIATEKLYPGVSELTPPTVNNLVLEDDLYRNIAYQWADAAKDGKAITEVLGLHGKAVDFKEEYNFYAVTELDGVTNYVASLKDAQLSISYVSQFWQHFYLPVVEGMERPTITGSEPDSSSATVIINRQEYYLYTFWENASAILNTSTINVNYTIDGVDYVAKVDISGLIYADIILSNQSYYAAEAESVANMVRYAYECYAIKSQTDSSVAANLEKYSAKITELIGTFAADGSTMGGKYNLNAYTTSFGEVAESDIENYGEYIHSMAYGIFGTSGRTMVILTKEATDTGVKIFFNGSVGRKGTTTIKNSETGEDETVNVYYVDNQKIYNAIDKITVTIKDPDKEDINTSYSLPQYITVITEKLPEENINVAKAMYDFGVAAKAYVNGLSDY